ncbi:MAG: hypothetical protein QOH88_3252 [Verrucomicrobiota bacterium]|jgi:hypothetical protein
MSETGAIPDSTGGSAHRPDLRPRTFVLIWLAIATLFLSCDFSFYFLEQHYEGGDFAANALQIREAKAFRELYGNYSRFGFHHPGPAFFYAYALGETVFFDFLKIVPAPHNAHAIIGLLLQAFFFTWALFIVTKRIRSPLLLPLLLVFAAAHFSIVNLNIPGSAFESIWPPYVLLCPFLCFVVACASLASGEVKDLIPALLAGCFLVHGHVAQPLFVIPLFGMAYGALWFGYLRRRDNPDSTRTPGILYSHICGGVIVALFLLPIVVDACKGEESNLRGIFHHFAHNTGDRKSLSQSLVYLAAFFYYVPNPNQYCDQLILSNLTFLVNRSHFFVMWILVLIVILVVRKPSIHPERRFFNWLVICFVFSVLLTIVWGMMQNAEMFAFNAYFNFSLLFVPFILLGIVLLSPGERVPRTYLLLPLYLIAACLWIATAKSWTLHPQHLASPNGSRAAIEAVRSAAEKDGQLPKTKFLSFQHGYWDWAAGAALALQRLGYDYVVPWNWSFIFGSRHVGGDLVASVRSGQVALWTVTSPAVSGDNWVSNSAAPIDPGHAQILFAGTEANAQTFAIAGWDVSTGPFSWSTQKTALIFFQALPASADVQIDFHVFPFNFGTSRIQRMSVSFNNEPPQSFEVAKSGTQSMRIVSQVWNRQPYATLAFEFPDAISPKEVGESTDGRTLACGFTEIDFHYVDASVVPEK